MATEYMRTVGLLMMVIAYMYIVFTLPSKHVSKA